MKIVSYFDEDGISLETILEIYFIKKYISDINV